MDCPAGTQCGPRTRSTSAQSGGRDRRVHHRNAAHRPIPDVEAARHEPEGWRVARRGDYRVTFRIPDNAHALLIGRVANQHLPPHLTHEVTASPYQGQGEGERTATELFHDFRVVVVVVGPSIAGLMPRAMLVPVQLIVTTTAIPQQHSQKIPEIGQNRIWSHQGSQMSPSWENQARKIFDGQQPQNERLVRVLAAISGCAVFILLVLVTITLVASLQASASVFSTPDAAIGAVALSD